MVRETQEQAAISDALIEAFTAAKSGDFEGVADLMEEVDALMAPKGETQMPE